MTHPIISVENLGKRYTIRHREGRPNGGYRRLSEDLVSAAKAPLRWLSAGGSVAASSSTEDFWALRNVSFEVNEGEVLAIIGRNGAGKSTLLKILSRITEPSAGRVTLRGRVASLLEVGTGFHPELTGRENVFLNGAILGMSQAEIRRRFDEIVAFAEVERFLDTPVKRYSSGMYVRLAFAVAAHLDPEILVVDEVLAVGDASFQQKCLGRMKSVGETGRTVLFVSHNMAAVRSLCTRGILLVNGAPTFDGGAGEATEHYASLMQSGARSSDLRVVTARTGTQQARFTSIHFENERGALVDSVDIGQSLTVVLRFECSEPVPNVNFIVVVSDSSGQRVFRIDTMEVLGKGIGRVRVGGEARCRIPRLMLVPDSYCVTIGITDGTQALDRIEGAGAFRVSSADVFGTGRHPGRLGGASIVMSEWKFASQ